MRQVTKLDKAKAALVLDHPFFAAILLRRPMVARTDIPILGINQRGTIFYNPEGDRSAARAADRMGLGARVHALHGPAPGAQEWAHPQEVERSHGCVDQRHAHERERRADNPGCVNMPGSKDKTCEQIYDEDARRWTRAVAEVGAVATKPAPA